MCPCDCMCVCKRTLCAFVRAQCGPTLRFSLWALDCQTDWNNMSTPASVCSACWDFKRSSSTAQQKLWASGRPNGYHPTHFTKIGSYELHCNPDILTSCKNACEESTTWVERLKTNMCGECLIVENIPVPHRWQQALVYAIINVKNLWQKAPARLPYKDRGSRGDVMSVCLVVLNVWAHRCVFVTAEELGAKDGRFFLEQRLWGMSDFSSYTHTPVSSLSTLAQGH